MKEIARNGALNGVVSFIVTVAVRICDIGGWLDTWFAKSGELLNIAALSRPFGGSGEFRGVEVTLDRYPLEGRRPGTISVMAADPTFDTKVRIANLARGRFKKKNLLLAALSLLPWKRIGTHHDLVIRIMSPIPPGASMGTSAAVAVALLKAVNELLKLGGYGLSEAEIAELAWKAETEVMGGQSGTQDQWAAAFSRLVSFITVNKFPRTSREEVAVSPEVMRDLEAGLTTVFVGRHGSSDVHKMVIAGLENEGPDSPRLGRFRGLARRARRYLEHGDLVGFGKVMIENTEAQRGLHKELVGAHHQALIDLAASSSDCLGWKVNGAGGAGGSVTLLFTNRDAAARFYRKAKRMFADEGYLYFEHRLAA